MNFLIVAFGAAMLFAAGTSQIAAHIRILAFQGLVLFVMVLLDIRSLDTASFMFLAIETFGFKTIIIPAFLRRTIRTNEIYRDAEPSISTLMSLIIATALFVLGFLMAFWANAAAEGIKPLYFGMSVSVMLISLFIILSRKMIITHIMGYMMMENGIFLLSLSVAQEMPLIVNMGVLLDVFAGIFLLAVLLNRIRGTYEDLHIDRLTDLKD